MNERDERKELLAKLEAYATILRDVVSGAQRSLSVVEKQLVRLDEGVHVGNLDTMFGVTDVAADLNTASRWEGRVWEAIDAAYAATQR